MAGDRGNPPPFDMKNAFEIMMASAKALSEDDWNQSPKHDQSESYLSAVRVCYLPNGDYEDTSICGIELMYSNDKVVQCGRTTDAEKSEDYMPFSPYEHIIGVEVEGGYCQGGVSSITLYTSD
jgi:hypothetical protein